MLPLCSARSHELLQSLLQICRQEKLFSIFLFPRRGRIAAAPSFRSKVLTLKWERGSDVAVRYVDPFHVTCASHVLGAGVTTSFSLYPH
jgi:hypothetical protein